MCSSAPHGPYTWSSRGEARLLRGPPGPSALDPTPAQYPTVLAKDPKAPTNPKVPLESPQCGSIVLCLASAVGCLVGPRFFSNRCLGPADTLSWRFQVARGHISWENATSVTLDLGTYQCLLSAGPHGSLVCRNWALSLATPRGEAVRRVRVGLSAGWVSGCDSGQDNLSSGSAR